jgi:toxin-antitoxin system PIN domain toxin
MILPDVNVLVGAIRPESARYAVCRRWLDSVVNGDAAFGMSPQVLCSVIRITTNARIFADPETPDEALDFWNSLLAQPHCHIIQPGPRHWSIFEDLCRSGHVRGPLVQDAWLAALAIESGCEWITFDRDFARFPGLRWREPEIPE